MREDGYGHEDTTYKTESFAKRMDKQDRSMGFEGTGSVPYIPISLHCISPASERRSKVHGL